MTETTQTQKAQGEAEITYRYLVTNWQPVWSDDEKRIDGYDSVGEWVETVPADLEESFLETFCDNCDSYTVKRVAYILKPSTL